MNATGSTATVATGCALLGASATVEALTEGAGPPTDPVPAFGVGLPPGESGSDRSAAARGR